jgi:hypothetical protein
MESQPSKRQRLDDAVQNKDPLVAHTSSIQPAPVHYDHSALPSILTEDLWKTIGTFSERYLREAIFHLLTGRLTKGDIHKQVVNALCESLRAKAEQEARERAQRAQIVTFEDNVEKITFWLDKNCVDQEPQPIGEAHHHLTLEPIGWGRHHLILDSIQAIKYLASRQNSNFATRKNGLEALRNIADTIWEYRVTEFEKRMIDRFEEDEGATKEAMLTILKVMSPEEQSMMSDIAGNSGNETWWEELEDLMRSSEKSRTPDGEQLFGRMGEVVTSVSNGTLKRKKVDDKVNAEAHGAFQPPPEVKGEPQPALNTALPAANEIRIAPIRSMAENQATTGRKYLTWKDLMQQED